MDRAMMWTGRLASALVVLALLADGVKAFLDPVKMDAMARKTGFPLSLNHPIGAMAIVVALVYAVPQTAVLGAILVTGYLGGAICTHLRIGEVGSAPQMTCVVLGLLTWAGLYLRDARLRGLLPLVR